MTDEPDETRETPGAEGPDGDGAAAGPDAGDIAAANADARRLRYTRRRLLFLGGAAVVGVAATAAGLRVWGGSGESSGGDSDESSGGDTGGGGPADFPVLSVEPPPDVPPADWVLSVDGLVDRPLTIDRETWSGLKRLDETVDFHCVTGWTADDVRWGGVRPAVLLEQAGLRPEASHAVFHAYGQLGGEYSSSLPLDLVTAPDTVLADSLDGRALPPRHGGPLRLVVPRQLGYKSVKWVVRIEITDASVPGYWEQRGYPDDAPVRG
jgi:hypothetical protein